MKIFELVTYDIFRFFLFHYITIKVDFHMKCDNLNFIEENMIISVNYLFVINVFFLTKKYYFF
jgi:hypothetical protein